MNLEKQPAKEKTPLPEGFTSQNQFNEMIKQEALRRIADIEAKRGMSPDEAAAYDANQDKKIQQAINETLMTIEDPAARQSFQQRMNYLKTAPEVASEIDRLKHEEGLHNRTERKLPPLPPLRKPPQRK